MTNNDMINSIRIKSNPYPKQESIKHELIKIEDMQGFNDLEELERYEAEERRKFQEAVKEFRDRDGNENQVEINHKATEQYRNYEGGEEQPASNFLYQLGGSEGEQIFNFASFITSEDSESKTKNKVHTMEYDYDDVNKNFLPLGCTKLPCYTCYKLTESILVINHKMFPKIQLCSESCLNTFESEFKVI